MGFGPSKRESDALDAQTGRARAEGQKAKADTRRPDQFLKSAEPNICAI